LRKRPYIRREWCLDVLAAPLHREVQKDRRIRFWGKIVVPGETRPRFLRVVTLADGETVHTHSSTAIFARTSDEAALLSGNGQPLHRAQEHAGRRGPRDCRGSRR